MCQARKKIKMKNFVFNFEKFDFPCRPSSYTFPAKQAKPLSGGSGRGCWVVLFSPLPCRGGVGGGVSVVLTANGVTDPTPCPSP